MKRNKFLTITLPLFFWAALILVLTSAPGEKMPEIDLWNWDKLAHCAVYFILSILLFRYLFLVRSLTIANSWKLGMLIGAAYACLDELHQIPIPNRLGTWQDFIADACGVAVGTYAVLRYFRWKMKKV